MATEKESVAKTKEEGNISPPFQIHNPSSVEKFAFCRYLGLGFVSIVYHFWKVTSGKSNLTWSARQDGGNFNFLKISTPVLLFNKYIQFWLKTK